MKSPSPSMSTAGSSWLPRVKALTWNSMPWRAPVLANRCAKTPYDEASWVLCQAMTKSPSLSDAMAGRY
jgi:hypothetical protein